MTNDEQTSPTVCCTRQHQKHTQKKAAINLQSHVGTLSTSATSKTTIDFALWYRSALLGKGEKHCFPA